MENFRDFMIREYNNQLSKYGGVEFHILWLLINDAITNYNKPFLINLLKRHYPEEITPYDLESILLNRDSMPDSIKNILLKFLEEY